VGAGAGAEVGAGAGAEVGAGVGFGAGELPPESGAGVLLPESDVDCFLGFFFLGSDVSAGTGAAAVPLTVIDADPSSTALVPSAVDLAVPPLSSEPPLDAFATPKARAKATTTAATVIPI